MALNEHLCGSVSRDLQSRQGMTECWEREQELLQQVRSQLRESRRPSSLRLSDKPCIELLFEVSWLGNGQDRFIEIKRFADELIACGGYQAITGRQVRDETLIAYRTELNVLLRGPFAQTINDALPPTPSQRAE